MNNNMNFIQLRLYNLHKVAFVNPSMICYFTSIKDNSRTLVTFINGHEFEVEETVESVLELINYSKTL